MENTNLFDGPYGLNEIFTEQGWDTLNTRLSYLLYHPQGFVLCGDHQHDGGAAVAMLIVQAYRLNGQDFFKDWQVMKNEFEWVHMSALRYYAQKNSSLRSVKNTDQLSDAVVSIATAYYRVCVSATLWPTMPIKYNAVVTLPYREGYNVRMVSVGE